MIRQPRRGDIGRNTLIALVVAIVATVGAGYGVYQLTRQERFKEEIAAARVQLQLDHNEEALASLRESDSAAVPAEYHYLKAIALDRLKRSEPAMAEIRQALKQSPDNPKYKGLELRFRLFALEKAAMDQLIELNEDFASVGPVALFATYGFQAKAMLLESERQPKAAEFHHDRRRQTLDTALALSGEMPELFPELADFARKNDRSEDALRLTDEQLELEPDSIPLRTERIRLLVALKRVDEAVEIAEVLHNESGRKELGAEFYASVLSQASNTKQHDATFQELMESFPRSAVVISKYAVYLTRTGRLTAAQKKIEDALPKQNDPMNRESLAFVSITLPLEVNSPELAEEQLKKYRSLLRDELLADYFEARILYLKKQYPDAADRMMKIVNAARSGDRGSQLLAEEALGWIRRMLADEILKTRLDAVADSTGKSRSGFEIRVEPSEKPDASTTPQEGEDASDTAGTVSAGPAEKPAAPQVDKPVGRTDAITQP